jgi:hypothetical protein
VTVGFLTFDFLKLTSSSKILPKHSCYFVLFGRFSISLKVSSVFVKLNPDFLLMKIFGIFY